MAKLAKEPACRVCSCTEYNACDDGCSWVRVESNSPPLCSACSGKPLDAVEVCRRVRSTFRKYGRCTDTARQANVIMTALNARVSSRIISDTANPDPAWGNR